MVKYPYLTFSGDEKHISLRVSQLKPYINRIKLPKDMFVELTFSNGITAIGNTSDNGFLITFAEWPDELPSPSGNILQTQVSKIKYWQEYNLEKPSNT
jgi:hypothetical protein